MAERRAVTEMTAIRYVVADRPVKSRILDELCANTGWHRNHARKALGAALQPKVVAPRRSPAGNARFWRCPGEETLDWFRLVGSVLRLRAWIARYTSSQKVRRCRATSGSTTGRSFRR